ncbi:helix-turn-helix transcriptional regulator [Rossellomorea marisflavi]|uniref:helix-turn-helix transcriptional regulator n=1 Tax=Rossellomorea marisflavi TaxID=189381 RepID=UPI00285372C7|nr:helix-turn-helix transcriptional regulator [Rossellomorea marisflavi]MDR4938084.1 helix-turn-helix transcriptional regulator [Rossellomorea marisflavi]
MFKKSRVFYRLFVPFFLLGVGLVLGFCIFIYTTTYNSVEESFLKDKRDYTLQVLHNVEQKVRTIEYGFTAYSSTSSFEETFKTPFYESEFDRYQDIRKEMSYIEMLGIEGNAYNLISLDQKWGIINGSLKTLTEQELDGFKEKYVEGKTQSLFWRPDGEQIEMIMTLPIYRSEKFAMGTASIPKRSIDQIVGDKEQYVEIYNKQDELLYSNQEKDSSLTSSEFNRLKEKAANGMTMMRAKDGRTYVYALSDYNQWLYMVEVNQGEIGTIIRNTAIGLVITSLLLILLVGFISYRLAESYSKPIRKIQEKLALPQVPSKENELSLLAASIEQVVDQNELLTEDLTRQQPQLETLFVLSLFRNRLSEKEVQNRLEQFGYDVNEKVFYTAVIQMDTDFEEQGVERDLFRLAINQVVAECIPESERFIPIVLNDEMQATILVFPETEEEPERKIAQYYESIQQAVKENLHVTLSAGISAPYDAIVKSKEAVDLAKESLYYRVNVGAESIIFFSDISQMVNDATLSKFPLDLHNQLLGAVRSGEEEEAVSHMDNLIADIFKTNKNPVSIGVTLTRIINDLVQLGQLLGADFAIFDRIKPLYEEAMNAYSPERIRKRLTEDLLKPVIRSTHDKKEQSIKSLSQKIVYIVETEFDQDLSLEQIADRLHYNPNYLSNVFKKEYGESFGDYLMNYRLQKAQRWLVETEWTVKEIAEKLQYRNSQNFIRFFKKRLDMTPGDYRKKHRH